MLDLWIRAHTHCHYATVLPQTDSEQSDGSLPRPAPAQTPCFQLLSLPLISPQSCLTVGLTAVHQAAPRHLSSWMWERTIISPRLYRFFIMPRNPNSSSSHMSAVKRFIVDSTPLQSTTHTRLLVNSDHDSCFSLIHRLVRQFHSSDHML